MSIPRDSRRCAAWHSWWRHTAGRSAAGGAASPPPDRRCSGWPIMQCGDTYARLAAGLRIGLATVYRYIRETVDLLARLAPTPRPAVAAQST